MKNENILDRYTADLLFRYIQLQLNELSEKLTNFDSFKAHVRQNLNETSKLAKDALDLSEVNKMSLKRHDGSIEVLRIEVGKLKHGVEAQLPPNLLSDLEKYQSQVNKFSSLMETMQKGESDKLRRIVFLETEMRQLQASAKFLTSKKLELDTKLKQEIEPLKTFKLK